jgi:hypothetical protein
MGRKSSITQLPDTVRAAVDGAIREGRATIDDIVAQVEGMGATASRSAVGRYKQSMEECLANYRQAQEVAGVWVTQLSDNPQGDVGRLLMEMLKTISFQTLASMGRGEATAGPEELMLLASAIQKLESAAKTNTETRAKIRAEIQAEMARKAKDAAAAITAEAKRGGLSDDTAARIREIMLGVVS